MNKCLQYMQSYRISDFIMFIILLILPIDAALGNIIGSISIINYFIVLFDLLKIIDLVKKRKISFFHSIIYQGVFVIYMCLTFLWGQNNEIGASNYYLFTLINSFVFCLLFSIDGYNSYEKKIFSLAIQCSFFIIIIYIILTISTIGYVNLLYSDRLFLNSEGRSFDPNFFSAGCVLLISVLMEKILTNKRNMYLLELTMIIFIVVLLGSRGGLAAIIMVIISMIISFHHFNVKIFLSILGGFVLLYIFLCLLSDNMLNRFSINTLLQSDGTGRFEIWNSAFEFYLNDDFFSLVFGHGIGQFRYLPSAISMKVAHNSFVSVLLEGGIIGIVLFFLMIFQNLYFLYKNNDRIILSAFIGIIVACLSLDMYNTGRIFWVIIMLGNVGCLSFKLDK